MKDRIRLNRRSCELAGPVPEQTMLDEDAAVHQNILAVRVNRPAAMQAQIEQRIAPELGDAAEQDLQAFPRFAHHPATGCVDARIEADREIPQCAEHADQGRQSGTSAGSMPCSQGTLLEWQMHHRTACKPSG